VRVRICCSIARPYRSNPAQSCFFWRRATSWSYSAAV